MDVIDETLKLCPHCGNFMMIQGKSSSAEYVCIICAYSETIETTTLINVDKISNVNINVINPRTMHESSSPLNSVLYRICDNRDCPSQKKKEKIALYRKVIFNDGTIKYYCQEDGCC